jgi:hypothetical protein
MILYRMLFGIRCISLGYAGNPQRQTAVRLFPFYGWVRVQGFTCARGRFLREVSTFNPKLLTSPEFAASFILKGELHKQKA